MSRLMWPQLSLTTRTVLLSNLLLVFAVVIGGALTWKVTSNELYEQMLVSGTRLVTTFAELNRLEFLDEISGHKNLQLHLNSLVQKDSKQPEQDNTIDNAWIVDARGQTLGRSTQRDFPRVLVKEDLSPTRVQIHGTAIYVATRVEFANTVLGYVVFQLNQKVIERARDRILIRSIAVLFASLLINMILLYALLQRLLKPLGALGRAAREFVYGNYQHRIQGPLRNDEVGDAAQSFNHMCDELETHLKFSNAALVDRIRSGQATDQGEEHHLSIVFGDAVNYTHWSQHRSPEAIFATMQRYYQGVGELMVRRFDGIIDKFIGDGLMAHFGLHHTSGTGKFPYVRQALRATIYSQMCLRIVGMAQKIQGQDPLPYRFGIATGRVLVGAIGAKNIIQDFSLIGSVVNLASRLESVAPPGGLVVDRFTYLDAGEDFLDAHLVGEYKFKGFDQAIQVFSVRGFKQIQPVKQMQRYLLHEFFTPDFIDEFLLLEETSTKTRQAVELMIQQQLNEKPFLPHGINMANAKLPT